MQMLYVFEMYSRMQHPHVKMKKILLCKNESYIQEKRIIKMIDAKFIHNAHEGI